MLYSNIIFDCDGVVLDSNRIKTGSFRKLFNEFGQEQVEEFARYHQANTGISRFVKVRYFFESILGDKSVSDAKVQSYVQRYGATVEEELMRCPMVAGLTSFIEKYPQLPKYIVSGGLESELHTVFAARNLKAHFDGIYGSPQTKDAILSRLKPTLQGRTLFFGDSRYDHEVANRFSLDFIFVSGYTEMQNWREYSREHSIKTIENFSDHRLCGFIEEFSGSERGINA